MLRSTAFRPLLTCFALAAAGCGGGDSPSEPPPPPATVQTVTVTPQTASLTAAGQTTTLVAEVRMSNGSIGAQAPAWSTSNPSVATVAAGVVTAVTSGTTTVTAAVGTVSGSATITVAIPVVQSITLTPPAATLVSLGETTRLTAEVRMSNGTVGTQTPTWSTSNASVATVNGGTVTAVSNGTATITAAVGTVTASATITVAQAIASVRVLPTDTVVKSPAQLRGAALDARGNVIAGAALQWTTLSPTITTVSGSGALTPLSTGVGRVRVSAGTQNATAIVRTIWNVTQLNQLVPLYEYSASAGQRRAFSDVSQNHADARAVLMGQVWSYLETILPTSGSPSTDMFFTTWLDVWSAASPFCGGVFLVNQNVWQTCTTPTRTHWMMPGNSPNDFVLITRFLTHQFLLSSMTSAAAFPWFLAGYPIWLAGGSFQGATLVPKPPAGVVADFRTGDTQNLLVPLDTLVRTDQARFYENLPQRTPVAVRMAQATLFLTYLDREYPTLIPAILARIRATPGASFNNAALLAEIQARTGKTLEELQPGYLAYARSLQP